MTLPHGVITRLPGIDGPLSLVFSALTLLQMLITLHPALLPSQQQIVFKRTDIIIVAYMNCATTLLGTRKAHQAA